MTGQHPDDRPCVVVLGAANLDSFHRVERLPQPGETVLGTGILDAVGGKGANQAIAAARAGAEVRFLGAIGRDPEGDRVLAALTAAGIDVDGLLRVDATATGRALILVDEDGQNVIVVTPAANAELSAADVAAFADAIRDADALVVQGEVPIAVTVASMQAAAAAGVRVVLNLAPYAAIGEALALADPLVLNEVEAGQLLDAAITGPESAAVVARLASHSRTAVVTLGAAGALVVENGAVTHVPAPFPARVVDTTGAGDAFVGVLAAALARGSGLVEAVTQAVRAATAAVEILGAGESYPVFGLDGSREAVAG